jgi:prepilin-type N-terminal cleavage/methylation domain-containing protein
MRYHSSRPSGFTLIELLTVIAIIGILAAVIIPTVGKARESAQRAVDASNLREITKAALLYAADNNDRLPDPQQETARSTRTVATPDAGAVYLWPGLLARKAILQDPSFYFSKIDPAFGGTYPTAILSAADGAPRVMDASFVTNTQLAWEFVGGVRVTDPPTTPIAFTRGLRADGHWDASTGVYKDAGGYIAFLGGNVQFYSDTVGRLVSNRSTKPVTNILEAIPYNTANPALSARIYSTAPGSLGSASGTPAIAGPN